MHRDEPICRAETHLSLSSHLPAWVQKPQSQLKAWLTSADPKGQSAELRRWICSLRQCVAWSNGGESSEGKCQRCPLSDLIGGDTEQTGAWWAMSGISAMTQKQAGYASERFTMWKPFCRQLCQNVGSKIVEEKQSIILGINELRDESETSVLKLLMTTSLLCWFKFAYSWFIVEHSVVLYKLEQLLQQQQESKIMHAFGFVLNQNLSYKNDLWCITVLKWTRKALGEHWPQIVYLQAAVIGGYII